jgi:hypothetical protein
MPQKSNHQPSHVLCIGYPCTFWLYYVINVVKFFEMTYKELTDLKFLIKDSYELQNSVASSVALTDIDPLNVL